MDEAGYKWILNGKDLSHALEIIYGKLECAKLTSLGGEKSGKYTKKKKKKKVDVERSLGVRRCSNVRKGNLMLCK